MSEGQRFLMDMAIGNATRLIRVLEQIDDWQFIDDMLAAVRDCDDAALLELADEYGLN